MTQRTRIITTGLLTLLLAGCVPTTMIFVPDFTNPNAEAPEEIIFSGKVYVIGELAGALAEEIAAVIEMNPYDGTSSDAPILIPGNMIETLDAESMTGIKATYAAHMPILLIEVTAEQINQFHLLLLDHEYAFSMPEGVDYAEVYALDLEADGTMFQWVQYPPAGTDADPDTALDRQARTSILVDWMDDNGKRMESDDAEAAGQMIPKGTADDLTQLTSAFVDQSNFSGYGNNYQITHYVYSCHSVDTGDDWFYVQQQCVLNGSGAYVGRVEWYQGGAGDVAYWYMDKVEINSYMNNYLNQPSYVGLVQSTPDTANNVTQVTSGVSWTIGGEVSVGSEGASGKLSAGVTISNSKTVNISDCTALNKSNDSGNNAHWVYQFNRCDSVSYFGYAGVTDPPNLSITTFQPLNQWIWRMNNAVRQNRATMHVDFTMGLVATTGMWDFMWVSHPVHTPLDGGSWSYDVCIPYPALP